MTIQSEMNLNPEWKQKIEAELASERMQKLMSFLKSEKKSGKIIYPPEEEYFAALNLAPFNQVKVVIVGQDPYHGPQQAQGLCFSVREGVPFPPSLLNIFKEIQSDLGFPIPKSGSLVPWARQGVLLLNSVLTVEEGHPASHQGRGWEELTDKIIHLLNEQREHLVFILWGAYAQKKAAFVDRSRHFVIESAHPSPLASYRGFFGSRPFSKANDYLRKNGIKEIDWMLI